MLYIENEINSGPAKRDLRVRKTYNALFTVLFTMLGQRNFNDITVNNMCIEANISRATFYSHFNDKYGLMKYFLTEIKDSIVRDVHKYDELEHEINGFINRNKKVVSNVLKDANNETMALIHDFMSDIVKLSVKTKVDNETCPHHIILFNFCVGGLVNMLTWIVENNFPQGINMMNTYLYELMGVLTRWDAEQGSGEPGR